MKKFYQFLLITLLSVTLNIGFSNSSFAQEDQKLTDLSLEELLSMPISVSSTKAQTIFNTPSSVSVIDAKMIKKYNFSSVSEALEKIPGMQVIRTYLKRDLPTARGILQDHYANKVLVLINGVATWNTVTSEASINKINIHDVERIEVLKGPASVLYGTNAYVAAINIVLKDFDKETISSYFGTGTNGLYTAGANYFYTNEDLKILVSGNSSDETGQDYVFAGENKLKTHYNEFMKGSSFNFTATYKGHTVLFNTFKSVESYLGVDPNVASGTGNDHWSNGYLASYKFESNLAEQLSLKYNLTYDWNQRNLSRTFDDNTRSNLKGYRLFNALKLNYDVVENLNIEFGFDYDIRKSIEYMNYNVQKDSILAVNDMNNRKVNEYSFFGQVGYMLGSFNLLVGTRYSQNELFGSNLSSRATLVYSIDEKNSFKLMWGQSYRAPSLFELYFRTPTNTVFGNTSLKPEKSNAVEIAYLTSFDKFFIQALVYHSFYENKIFRTRRNPTSTTDKSTIYMNGSTFKATGLELEAKYQNDEVFDMFVSYTYTDGNNGDEVVGSGQYNFKFVPQHFANVGISKRFGGVFASVVANYISETSGFKTSISSSSTFDFNIGYEHKFNSITLRHNLTAKNLFDTKVLFPEYSRGNLNEVPSGYGRRIFYELQFQI